MADPFELLGVEPSATADEVKAAWRKLAVLHHPDRGGDAAEFDRYHKAYDEALVEAQAPKTCDACVGVGKVKYTSGFSSIMMTCPKCGGSGTLVLVEELKP